MATRRESVCWVEEQSVRAARGGGEGDRYVVRTKWRETVVVEESVDESLSEVACEKAL